MIHICSIKLPKISAISGEINAGKRVVHYIRKTYPKIKELLYPNSVAVLGVSDAFGNLGRLVVNVLGQEGFPGKIFPGNPRLEELLGNNYPSIEDIEEPVGTINSGLTTKWHIPRCL